ncbi:hypothetical protein Tco_1490594 [Tanacetum coccineum]
MGLRWWGWRGEVMCGGAAVAVVWWWGGGCGGDDNDAMVMMMVVVASGSSWRCKDSPDTDTENGSSWRLNVLVASIMPRDGLDCEEMGIITPVRNWDVKRWVVIAESLVDDRGLKYPRE